MFRVNERGSFKELSVISNNLGMLNGEGLNITKSIHLLKDFPITNKYNKALNVISIDIVNGKSLYEAFGKHKKLFPDFYIQMIKSGEESGKIVEVFNELGDYYSEMERIKKEIIGACIYPLIILTTMLFIFVAFIFLVIPNFEKMIGGNIDNLPFFTQILLNLSKFIREKWKVTLMILIIWGCILPYFFFKRKVKKVIINMLNKFNLTRNILEYKIIITLNTIISSGMNLSRGLLVCGNDIDIFLNIYHEIIKGNGFAESLRKCSNLSEYSLAMIEIGEESGTLEKSIRNVTNVLKNRNKESLDRINKLIQPVIILIIAFIVLIFIISFILPLFEIIYNIGV